MKDKNSERAGCLALGSIRPGALGLEDYKLKELKKRIDQLCAQIQEGMSLEEFYQEEKAVRDFALRQYPDKAELYELLYRSRFKRLWEQFRNLKIEFPEG